MTETTFKMLPPPALPDSPLRPLDLQALAASIPATAPEVTTPPAVIEQVAWDMAMMPSQRDMIINSYGLTYDELLRIQQLPLYASATKQATNALKADPNLLARNIARAGIDSAIRSAIQLASSGLVEPRDRLKAVDLLSRMVGMEATNPAAISAGGKKGGGGTGVAIQINLGQTVGAQITRTLMNDADEHDER